MLLSCDIKYNANGLLTFVRRYEVDADDVATAVANSIYEYNANNAVTSITHNNSSGTEIVKHSYAYDSTNNIVEYLNSLDGSTSYDYDFLGQLISADYSNAEITDESYTYDENGNRVVANGSNYTTSTNNELTSDGTWSYTYDDEGNRLTKTNSTNRELYTWDYRNRLTSVTQQTYNAETGTWENVQIVEYTYDYNNVWIRKTLDSNGDGTADSKSIFIPENYQTIAQIDNGTVSHYYLWTPNQQDKLLADVTADNVLWTLTDHLGTIRDIIGTTTTPHLIYDAFGNLVSGTNPILFGYTGKAFDTSTSLQNNINRWYAPTVGRWLSTDPISFEGEDTNLYRYVFNIPSNRLDFLGLKDTYVKCDSETRKIFIGYEIRAIGVVGLLGESSTKISGSLNPSPTSGGYQVSVIRCGLCKVYEQIQTCRTYQRNRIYGIIPCDTEIAIHDKKLKERFYEVIQTQNVTSKGNVAPIISASITLITIPVPGTSAGPGIDIGTKTGFMSSHDKNIAATQKCKLKANELKETQRKLMKQ